MLKALADFTKVLLVWEKLKKTVTYWRFSVCGITRIHSNKLLDLWSNMLTSIFLATLLSFPESSITGYWYGTPDEHKEGRHFLVYRSNEGEYISLQQFLDGDKVSKWNIQFGYWELVEDKIVVSHVGTYDALGSHVTQSCELEKSKYQITESSKDKLLYFSLESNASYTTFRTTPNEIKGNRFVDYIDVIIKGIHMHRANCEKI
ncbi:hypothetical protein KJY73_13160 [Bowmanella sp. Y26]|uniref:hypothetical protein n=1 Tax=Bowmanella yangjiangensis TaxID=2811230 RepID=UPI001BDD375C|nr:hypothetical protein [Bowmanella yangjiangensis]MBT1064532.1 hypothetical protein [Bowmanella yangjiangensis]